MRAPKPPIVTQVKNVTDIGRLALALAETPSLLWHFAYGNKHYLGTFSLYMSWKGDIPIFAYITLDDKSKAFLAYKGDGEREECFFASHIDDTRYVYAPIIDMKNPPSIFKAALDRKWPPLQHPLTVQLDNTESLVRLLYLISLKEYMSFPVWSFKRGDKNILGVVVPFEHYYESNALPIFFYLSLDASPKGPFLRYITSKTGGEILDYCHNTGEPKYFYAKIIHVEDLPLFPK